MDDLAVPFFFINRATSGDIPLSTICADLDADSTFPIGGMIVIQIEDDIDRPGFDVRACKRWIMSKTEFGVTAEEVHWLH